MSAQLSIEHTWSLHDGYQLVSNLNMIYQDQQYRQAYLDPASLGDAFFKVNATVTLVAASGWEASLLVKNLTDEESFSYVNDTPLVDGARQFIPDHLRTIAVRGTWRF